MTIRVRSSPATPEAQPRAGRQALAVSCVFTAALAWACGSTPAPTPPPITINCPAGPAVESPDGNPVAVSFELPTATGGKPPFTTTCAPISGSSFPIGSTTVTCQAVDSAGGAGTCTFGVTVRAPPQLLYTNILAFGDSITEGKASEPVVVASALFRELSRSGAALAVTAMYQSPEPYPLLLQRRLASRYVLQSFAVANAGLGGETAAEGALRFRSVLAARVPELVLLMEGSNDLLSPQGADYAILALDSMVSEAMSRGVRVCLATIPPQRPNGLAARGPIAARVPPFNDQVRALAAARGVLLVDVYDAMKDRVDVLIGIDDLHPTEQGLGVIADTFYTALRNNLERTPAATAGVRAQGAMR